MRAALSRHFGEKDGCGVHSPACLAFLSPCRVENVLGSRLVSLPPSPSSDSLVSAAPLGIPKFFRWLSERYPAINQNVTADACMPEFGEQSMAVAPFPLPKKPKSKYAQFPPRSSSPLPAPPHS